MSKNTAPSFFRPKATGKINFDFGSSNDSAHFVLVQADGKILVAGQTNFGTPAAWKMGIVRYNADGSLDFSFGNKGKVASYFQNLDVTGYAIAIQEDGKILMTGQAFTSDSTRLILCRYNVNGQLDTTFGDAGTVFTGIDSAKTAGRSMSIQTDGKIIVGGEVTFGKGDAFTSDSLLVRYLPDGTLDKTFNSTGISQFDTHNSYDNIDNLLIQPDGKIVVSGIEGVARINQNGSLDESFAQQGRTPRPSTFQTQVKGIALDESGNIYTVGYGSGLINGQWQPAGVQLAKFKANGSLDTGFGRFAGVEFSDLGASDGWSGDVVIQQDGKLIVAGKITDGINSYFTVLRFLPSGSLDSTFGSQGKVILKAGVNTATSGLYFHDDARKIALQKDGKILVAGQSFNGANTDFGVIRLNPDGSLDTGFGEKGELYSLDTVVNYVEGYPLVPLAGQASIIDAELSVLNNGKGNYDGASIQLQRVGGVNLVDEFNPLGTLKFEGDLVVLAGVQIGKVEKSPGMLKITFNANATQERVDFALNSIGYRNDSKEADHLIQISWVFDDGNHGAQGEGNQLQAQGTTAVKLISTNEKYPYWIDAIIKPGSSEFIQALLGASKMYQYSLLTSAPDYGTAHNKDSFLKLTDDQKVLIKSAFSYVSSILDLKFVETTNPAQLNTIAIANYELPEGLGASASYPQNVFIGSDINLNGLSQDSLHPSAQSGFYATFMHEFGHALGLQHPFENRASGRILSDSEDNANNTVMSYRDTLESHAIKYGPLDIAALQYLYGVSPAARPGDDVYKLSTLSSNFIWDGAGIDTISAEGIQQSVTLHLTPGIWDYIGARGVGIMSPGQVTVNFGSRIENLIGGSHSDFLFGSDFDNRIDGGAGNDAMFGGKGNDVINGGDGFDQASYSHAFLAYSITKTANGLSIKDKSNSDDSDVLSGIESLRFDDISINLTVKEKAASISAAEVKTLIEIYVAFFNRTPDADGLSYWIDEFKAGKSISSISESFYSIGASPQFAALTGFTTNMTNTDFINTFYKNVLGRSDGADPGGLEYWMNKLTTGASTRGSLAQDILNSAHTFKGHAEFGYVADLLDNKYLVGKTVAIDWGITHNNNPYGHGIEIAKAVTPTNIAAALKLVGISDLDMQFM